MKVLSMIQSCHIRCRSHRNRCNDRTGSRMQDSRLRRLLNGAPSMVQCI